MTIALFRNSRVVFLPISNFEIPQNLGYKIPDVFVQSVSQFLLSNAAFQLKLMDQTMENNP